VSPLLELIFQGFLEWAYGLALECWQYFSTALLDIMSMDFAYLKSHAPVVDEIMQILLAVGWALLIGNLVFQALKSMAGGRRSKAALCPHLRFCVFTAGKSADLRDRAEYDVKDH
jgi:hypothetical protein